MSAQVPPVAWPAIRRLHEDVVVVFSASSGLLGSDVPVPRVTFDLVASDPEPCHVFTLSNAHDFSVVGFLTNNVVQLAFDVDVVCVATAPSVERASEIANAYQSLLLQVALCDPLLGGTANEVGVPQVADYRVWADQDGRRHAGYRMAFNVSVNVSASDSVREVIEGIQT